jgi:hypothetical protein
MRHTRTTTDHATDGGALFKADHPREIDRHIAFFGDHETTGRDMCGEALLDALTHRSSPPDDDEA